MYLELPEQDLARLRFPDFLVLEWRVHAQLLSCVRLFATLWPIYSPLGSSVHGIFQARIWSGLPFPPPEGLPNPGIVLASSALAGGFFTTEPPGKTSLSQ